MPSQTHSLQDYGDYIEEEDDDEEGEQEQRSVRAHTHAHTHTHTYSCLTHTTHTHSCLTTCSQASLKNLIIHTNKKTKPESKYREGRTFREAGVIFVFCVTFKNKVCSTMCSLPEDDWTEGIGRDLFISFITR